MKAPPTSWRTTLVLGRVSNLPTVWSNLATGWFLAGGGNHPPALATLLAGGSLLYVGGMFLNDFCDAGFDAGYRRERPIPAGLISRRTVGGLAALWLALGAIFLVALGWKPGALGLLLLGCIVLYDWVHKKMSAAPWLMAACRFLLYLVAASAVAGTISPRVILSAAVLGGYVAGITCLARGESRPQGPTRWALIFLLLPFANAAANLGHAGSLPAVFASGLLAIWMGGLLIPFWRGTRRSIGRVVAGLLAGIVLVDIVAAAPVLGFGATWFLLFFGFALLLQRSIPAT
jgi:hypothetical protein